MEMDKFSMKMKTTILATLSWWLVVMMAMPLAQGRIDQSPEAVDKWFKEVGHKKEKLTKLHFYVQDNFTSENPTSVLVAQGNNTAKSPTLFGATFVFDDPMTLGPEPGSKIIGRNQGISSSASKEDASLITIMNFVFTDGQFNGSTLALVCSDPIFKKYQEMPIVGGSGVFRLARGIATAITYAYNDTTHNSIAEYYIVVLHY